MLLDAEMFKSLTSVSLWEKSRFFASFSGAFCSCFGMVVVLFELKIFLCCIKKQKQRYFREITKQ